MTAGNLLRIFTTLCLGSLGVAAFGQTSHATAPSSSKAAPSAQAVINYGKLPLSFEPNLGQTSGNVQWLARGPEYTLFLAGDDAVLEMNKIVPPKRGATDLKDMKPSITSSAVRMSLLGARNPEQTGGEDLQSGKANYFTGNDPAKWQHNVPMYGKVRMKGVYPGVDLVYYGHRGELEYDFVVAPGADASAIKLRFDGSKAALAANGSSTVSLTISASKSAANHAPRLPWMSGLIAFALLAGFPLAQRRTRGAAVVLLALAISTLGVLVACGGGGGTQPPQYTVTISATGGISSTIGVNVQ